MQESSDDWRALGTKSTKPRHSKEKDWMPSSCTDEKFRLGGNNEEEDAYDFDATGSSRFGHSEDKRRGGKKKKKESKLVPRGGSVAARTKTTEERIADILARTRSPANTETAGSASGG
ncbi:unnamed protein product, partial [Discosporangium mesarthrocarpum]